MTKWMMGLALLLAACSAKGPAKADQTSSQAEVSAMSGLTFTDISGEEISLDDYRGHPVLVVNTASKCGYTPQYEGLQALWEAYRDQGLIILGVPSGDFGNQEFASNAEVKHFCELNFGVDFPLTEKTIVSGADRHAFYTYAESVLGDAAVPKWNFHKILLNKEGVPVKAFPSSVKPQDQSITSAIEALL